MMAPLPNPLNTVPKSSLETLLYSLTESPVQPSNIKVQPTHALTIESPVPEITDLLPSESINKEFLIKQNVHVLTLDSLDSIVPYQNTDIMTGEALETTTLVSMAAESNTNEVTSVSIVSETPSSAKVEESSNPSQVTLQSFLEAISQSRVEDAKVDLQDGSINEGPFLLPFRTTLRTTTLATTTTTTSIPPETTTAGKYWLIT